ncbi:TetR family transcriptional regulator, partial [Salmonella enterica subsp. enterica serovar Typhimurium]
MLATHLGISKSAIYHHVESKEAILDHAVTEALDALEACLDDVVASGADAGAQVEAAIRGTLGVLAEKQPEVTLL